ncbi:LOW QUALITY PROTEIN: rhomboid domain-containing protein 3 [Callorhinchus milii]|uniref:LOW QUALITY PROTEIN: rhomboid domain-containing protein 3 n=1 Tax=Callorhinchus milii TaxID=7868 RepID=UPI001C3FA3DE|nr:LOW QUALITY PROTEIN: rhomboid domain-containing protein 3 [Callorhinchus milii]
MRAVRSCCQRLRAQSRVPAASACFLSVIGLLWAARAQEALSLTLSGVVSHRQVYRLLGYCFSHGNLLTLLINLSLIVLLSSRLEQQLGTVRFLYLSVLFALLSAFFYLLLDKLLSLEGTAARGFTTVQFAMVTLGCHSSEVKRIRIVAGIKATALPWILLAASYLFIPDSSAPLHACGVIVGLAYSYRFFFFLELPETVVECVESFVICKFLRCGSYFPFISSPARDRLPITQHTERLHPIAEGDRASGNPKCVQLQQLHAARRLKTLALQWILHACPLPPEATSWNLTASQPRTKQWHSTDLPANLYNQRGLGPTFPITEVYDLSPNDLYATGCLITDDDLLQAGVIASLQESRSNLNSKVEVPKSSVSSLRLQQLERMGFSTEKAVLALAASGKVESAVHLLVDDQVGEEAVVTVNSKH